MEIKAVHHLCITVKDLKASLHFYQDLLKMEFSRAVDSDEMLATYLWIPGGVELELIDRKGTVKERPFDDYANGLSHIAFLVDNPEEYAEMFRKEGYEFHMELSKLPQFKHYAVIVYDPDGVPVEFVRRLREDEIKD